MSEWIGMAIFGLIVGAIAKFIMPGRDPGGFIITALIGVAGSLLGTYVGRTFLMKGADYQARWVMSIAGTLILLALYRLVAGRRA